MKYTESQIRDIICKLVISKPNAYCIMLRRRYPDIVKFLTDKYPELTGHSLAEYCYWFLTGLTDFPSCGNPSCTNKLDGKFRNIKVGYLTFCSSKCSATSDSTRSKFRHTTLSNYGVDHPVKSQSVKDKIKQTNLARYGVACTLENEETKNKSRQTTLRKYGTNYALQNADIKKKQKKTNLERYGVECTLQNECVKEKAHQTVLKKYGVDNVAQSPIIQDKIRQTSLAKYGVEYPTQSVEVKTKTKNTNIERYGVDNPFKSPEIRRKCKNTCLKKYGVENGGGSAQAIEKIRHTTKVNHGVDFGVNSPESKLKSTIAKRKKSYYENVITEFDGPTFTIDFFIENYSSDSLFEFKCKKCGNIFKSRHRDGRHERCPICYPKTIASMPEVDMTEFVKQYYDVVENSRKIIAPYELDIYVPEKKLALEFDGLFWHSDSSTKSANYHLMKTEMCENQGIQLIHIFENEWKFKHDIVTSRIKNLLGIYDAIVYARKCTIQIVDSDTSRAFQRSNHIQGAVNAKVNIGLFYNGELISLMTFGKPRFNRKYEWELLRFCNKLGYHIPGAASRLLKYFERNFNPTSVISYADRRWSQGKVYNKLGFTLDHVSKPDYWYWKGNNFYHRSSFQKHKLKNLLENFDENLTESENMKNNGYSRIYDCGNLVFVKVY